MTQVSHTITDLPQNDIAFESGVSQNLRVLSKQLRELVKNAEKIQSEEFQVFKHELSRKLLWLRPSVNRISAISCCEKTPQLGFSGVTSGKLQEILETQLSPPGRKTPEKKLQSWLIRQALESGGRVKALDRVLVGQWWFVSDEIALNTASRKKLVADLLLVRVDAEGQATLVNAELKSERSMKTFTQVIDFRAALDDPALQNGWKTFANIMTGNRFQWRPFQETNGVVIWPAVGKNPSKAWANTKRKNYERVDVIGYRYDPATSEYTLGIENLAENA